MDFASGAAVVKMAELDDKLVAHAWLVFIGWGVGVPVAVLRNDPSAGTEGPAVAAPAAAAAAAAASADSPDYSPTQGEGVNAPAAAWDWAGSHACGRPVYPYTPLPHPPPAVHYEQSV